MVENSDLLSTLFPFFSFLMYKPNGGDNWKLSLFFSLQQQPSLSSKFFGVALDPQ